MLLSRFQDSMVVVDVSGPHSVRKPVAENGSKNKTRGSIGETVEVSVFKFTPTVQPTFLPETEDVDDIDKLVIGEKESDELIPEKPIVLYISRDHTGPNARVMKVLPALAALKHNEKYSIINGNSDELFTLNERHGVASLKFTRKVQSRMTYKLEILCEPVHQDSLVEECHRLNLEHFVINMEIHVL